MSKEDKEKEAVETAEESTPPAQEEETETVTEEAEEVNETEALKAEIASLNQKVAVLKNEYAKAYADTENTRKRLQKEHETYLKYHIRDFAMQILPVLDDCERALAQQTEDENYRKGVEMIYNKLKAALEKEGVTEIEAEGKPFDPNWHQAIMSEEAEDTESGIVLQVFQKGYKLKDRLLRAAMVKISA
ncbi:MAG: nucleotide exchange factor GrpE [Solobacterium sp.]|nr:nucleotide exchange factor GrpE [Solobacterium sp.]